MDSETIELKKWIKKTVLREYILFGEVMKMIENSDLEKEMLIDTDCSDGEELDEQLDIYSILCANIDTAFYLYKEFMRKFLKLDRYKKLDNNEKIKSLLCELEDVSLNFFEHYDEFLLSIHESFYEKEDGQKMLLYYKFIRQFIKKIVNKNEFMRKEN